MSQRVRKYSITSHSSNDSMNSIDSQAYSTDKSRSTSRSTSRSNSLEKEILNNLTDSFDNSYNLFKKTNKSQFRFRPIGLRKLRRQREQNINKREKILTPTVNYDYLNFSDYVDLENISENEKDIKK